MTSRLPSGAIPHNINIILLSLSKSINQTFHTLLQCEKTVKPMTLALFRRVGGCVQGSRELKQTCHESHKIQRLILFVAHIVLINYYFELGIHKK